MKEAGSIVHALEYPVRPQPVLKYLGQPCVVAALLILVLLIVSIVPGDYAATIRYSIAVVGVFVGSQYIQSLGSLICIRLLH
jgi:hypothetical protein